MSNVHRERHSLMMRLARMAGSDGVAGGVTSNGEAWVVRSRTIARSDVTTPDLHPNDVMAVRLVGTVLHVELRNGTTLIVPPPIGEVME